MGVAYLDTSALVRVLLREPGWREVLLALARFEQRTSSRLLRLELLRVGVRTGRETAADRLLDGVALVPLDEVILRQAERIAPATVASLDAIHLATAVRLAAAGVLDTVMTYDRRLADGAAHHGLQVVAPA